MFIEPKRRELRLEVLGQPNQQSALYDPTTAAVARTYAEEATIGVGTLKADLTAMDVTAAEETGARVTEEEYKNSAELYSEGVQWHDGMTRESALISKEFNDAARKRAQIIADSSTGQSVIGFGAGFAAGVLEPKNVVSGLAVGAIAGPFAELGIFGKSLQRAYQIRKTASLGQKVLMGGAEGVAAGVVVEPSNRYSAKILQQDYTMMDSLFNVATSTAFSAAIPALPGIKNIPAFMQEKVAKFKGRTMDVVAAEVDLATSQFASGQRVDVGVIEAGEIGSVANKSVDEKVKAALNTESLAYHGTQAIEFDGAPRISDGSMGKAFYMSNDAAKAESFGKEKKIADNIVNSRGETVERTVREPNAFDAANVFAADLKELNIKTVADDVEFFNLLSSKKHGIKEAHLSAQLLGYDGVYNKATGTYAIYNPEKLTNKLSLKDAETKALQQDATNAQTLAKAQADALDPKNDTLIDYDAIDAMDERRAIMGVENEAEAEAYFQNAEAEIRQMLADDILNDADVAEYRTALEELDSRTPIDALETLKLCFTRG
jgi:hypothetical protein